MNQPALQKRQYRETRQPRVRSWALYVGLTALFLVAFAYQFRTLELRFPHWFGAHFIQWPFMLEAEDQPHFKLQFLERNARDAGLRQGDDLIALNGVSVPSRSVYSDVLSASHPGDIMDVTFQRQGKQPEEHAPVRLAERRVKRMRWRCYISPLCRRSAWASDFGWLSCGRATCAAGCY